MDMSTLDKIGKKINYFYDNSGIKPTYIYLGRKEMLAVKDETVLHRAIRMGSNSTITTIFGYEVYEIDSDSHLSIGM